MTCAKTNFITFRGADKAARTITQRTQSEGATPLKKSGRMSAYKCPHCPYYHLTSNWPRPASPEQVEAFENWHRGVVSR